MPPDRNHLEEIYRLERENNKMLKSMKRRAFWGGIVKLVVYLFLLGVPVWLFFSYLYPVVEQLNETVGTISGGKIQIGEQFSGMAEWFAKAQDFFKGVASSTKQ